MKMLSMLIAFILRRFGFARVPLEAVQLAAWIRWEAEKQSPDMQRIGQAAAALESLFRSARL